MNVCSQFLLVNPLSLYALNDDICVAADGGKKPVLEPSIGSPIIKPGTVVLLGPCIVVLLSPFLDVLLIPFLDVLLSPFLDVLLSPFLDVLLSPCTEELI